MTRPEKTPTPDPIAILNEELADFEKQFTEAQQQVAQWNAKMLTASGAGQACKAVLARLESKPNTEATSPQ